MNINEEFSGISYADYSNHVDATVNNFEDAIQLQIDHLMPAAIAGDLKAMGAVTQLYDRQILGCLKCTSYRDQLPAAPACAAANAYFTGMRPANNTLRVFNEMEVLPDFDIEYIGSNTSDVNEMPTCVNSVKSLCGANRELFIKQLQPGSHGDDVRAIFDCDRIVMLDVTTDTLLRECHAHPGRYTVVTLTDFYDVDVK